MFNIKNNFFHFISEQCYNKRFTVEFLFFGPYTFNNKRKKTDRTINATDQPKITMIIRICEDSGFWIIDVLCYGCLKFGIFVFFFVSAKQTKTNEKKLAAKIFCYFGSLDACHSFIQKS